MQNPINLPIVKKIQETNQAIQLVFQDNSHQIKAFLPGQFLTFMVTINGEQHRRSYSICTSPKELPFIGVCVKRVEGGLVSNFLLDNAKEGDYMQLIPPFGNFTYDVTAKHGSRLVLFAGGSGITPMMSIIKTVLSSDEESKIYLYYANSNQEQIIFHQELETLSASHPNRFQVTHLLSRPLPGWDGPSLRCNASLVQDLIRYNNHHLEVETQYYMCGPAGMMESVLLGLETIGIGKTNMHKESFVSSSKTPKSIDSPETNHESAFDVTIIYGGAKHAIKVASDEKILEKALEANIDLPYACQMGICGMCRATVKQGKISMEEQEAISESEINAGACLTCVGKPASAGLIIDYDC